MLTASRPWRFHGTRTALQTPSKASRVPTPDGRVLGKMGHSERIGEDVAKNVPGDKDQQLFEAGVAYYK